MRFGADYYPEHWPEERWPEDARLMAEAGMNIVRVAEFAWSRLEPEPGRYDFTWLDRAIEELSSQHIDIVMSTPTATPPKWMMDAYPEIYAQDNKGRVRGFGTRRHYCPNSPVYLRESARIASVMAERYAQRSEVVAWQIDNEFGCHDTARCYCETCRGAFQAWLKNRYKSIDLLNKAWGTVFWSQEYRSWDEVIIPTYAAVDAQERSTYNHNPGLLLDFYRFSSQSVKTYQKTQIDEIRTHTKAPITHNFMGHFSDLDYFELAEDLDFVSWDNYPTNQWGKGTPSYIAMAHDIMRGTKAKPFWVMEEQSGPCGWNVMGENPEPGQIRLWTYQGIARGADGMVYFRWRACAFGIEEYWHGILGHDGVPRRRYEEVKKIGLELPAVATVSEGAMPYAEVAMIKSYENWWSHQIQSHAEDFSYGNLLHSYYDACFSAGVTVDIIPTDRDFNRYKMIFAVGLNVMDEELKSRIEAFVRNGGILITGFRSGTKTMSNSMLTEPIPGYLADVSGIEVSEFDILREDRTFGISGDGIDGKATVWCDIINPDAAQVMAAYSDGWFKGSAAITKNTFGSGMAIYVGCQPDRETIATIVGRAFEMAKIISPVDKVEKDVEIVEKRSDNGSVLFVLNHASQWRNVLLRKTYTDVLSEQSVSGELSLEPYGVYILNEKEVN